MSHRNRNPANLPSLILKSGNVPCSENVRDLGVTIDKNLTFNQHIKIVCRSASWGISKIGKTSKYLI